MRNATSQTHNHKPIISVIICSSLRTNNNIIQNASHVPSHHEPLTHQPAPLLLLLLPTKLLLHSSPDPPLLREILPNRPIGCQRPANLLRHTADSAFLRESAADSALGVEDRRALRGVGRLGAGFFGADEAALLLLFGWLAYVCVREIPIDGGTGALACLLGLLCRLWHLRRCLG